MFNQLFIKGKTKEWILSIILLPLCIYLIINNGEYYFIDNLNLLIHEGGHGLCRIFGRFIYTLGGTIFQIFIPSMFIWFYLRNSKLYLSQIFLVWLGENLINISIYAADAQEKKLTLLGGNKVYHDWNWILNKLDILEYDNLVGLVFFISGIITFIIAIILPYFLINSDNAIPD